MSTQIGSLVVEMSANVARLRTDMGEATKVVNRGMKEMADAARSVGNAFALTFAGAMVYAVTAYTKKVIDSADAMNDMTQRIGVNIKTLAAWQLAADQSGTTIESVAKGIKTLSGFMLEHTGQLKAAGITATDASGAMAQLADLFAALPDGVQKTALATQLFGKAGMDMIPMLNQGSAGLSTAAMKSREYAEQLARLAPQADEFNDHLAEMSVNSKAVGYGLMNYIMPGLNEIIGGFNEARRAGLGFFSSITIDGDLENAGAHIQQLLARRDSIQSSMERALANRSSFGPGSREIQGKYLPQLDDIEKRLSYFRALQIKGLPQGDFRDARDRAGESDAQAAAMASAQAILDAAEAEARAKERAAEAARKLMRAQQEAARAEESWRKEVEKSQEAIAKENYDLLRKAEQLEQEAQTYGMTQSQIEAVTIARLQEQLAVAQGWDGQEGLVKNLETEIAARQRLKEAMIGVEARAEAKKAAEEIEKQQAEVWRSIESTAHDVWTQVWLDGSSAFENIGKTIKSAILDLLYQITVKRWIIGISASVGGGSALASEGGGGLLGSASSLSSAASSVTNIVSLVGKAYSAISGLGAAVYKDLATSTIGQQLGLGTANSYAAPVYDGAGKLISEASGSPGQLTSLGESIGNGLATAGAAIIGAKIGSAIAGDYRISKSISMSTLGAGIGAFFGPLGAGIGGVVGGIVDRAFGSGPKKIKDYGITGTFSGTDFSGSTYQFWKKKGGWFRSNKKGTSYGAIDPEMDAYLGETFTALKLSVGNAAQALGVGTQAIAAYSKSITLSLKGKDAKTAIQGVFNTMADEMAAIALSGSNFGKEGERASDTLTRLANSLTGANTIFHRLGQTLLDVSLAGGDAASQLMDMAGGKEQFASKIDTYYQAIYSQQERNQILADSLKESFGALDLALPTTRDGFRDLVEAQDKMTESGRATYLALLDMVPAFSEFVGIANSFSFDPNQFKTAVDFQFATRTGVNPKTLPAFADGGVHSGGWAMVGERGPELAFLPPARVYSSQDSRSLVDLTPLASAIEALRADLRAVNAALVRANAKVAKVVDGWDQDGMPAVRTL